MDIRRASRLLDEVDIAAGSGQQSLRGALRLLEPLGKRIRERTARARSQPAIVARLV